MLADMWQLDHGTVAGCPPGTLVMLEKDGTELRLVRPLVGVVLRMGLGAATEEMTGGALRLTSEAEGIDVSLSRPPVSVSKGSPPSEPPAAESKKDRLTWLRGWRPFAIGALVAGGGLFLLATFLTVAVDLPNPADQVPPAYLRPDLITGLIPITKYALLLLIPLGFVIGWTQRGAGVLGAIVGMALVEQVPAGDAIARILNPYAFPAAGAEGGQFLDGLSAVVALDFAGVIVLGLLAWFGRCDRAGPSVSDIAAMARLISDEKRRVPDHRA